MTVVGMPFWTGLLPENLWGKIPSGIKITSLRTFVVHLGSVNWVFVKIYTNEGLVGLGEGSVTSKEATVAAAIQEHERLVVGKDPTQIEMLWQSMYRWPRWRGGPVLNSAISAVEIALWDIFRRPHLTFVGRSATRPNPVDRPRRRHDSGDRRRGRRESQRTRVQRPEDRPPGRRG